MKVKTLLTVCMLLFGSCSLSESLAKTGEGKDGAAVYEPFHVILMLEQGPIHARFGIALQSRPVAEQRAEYERELIESLDTDRDQKLTQEEANRSHILRKTVSKGTARFLRKMKLDKKQTLAKREVSTRVKKVAGQPVIFRQNNDAFASDEFIFELIDEDNSGNLDDREMATAARRLAARDLDEDECIGFDEVQPPPAADVDPNLVQLGVQQEQEEVSHSVFSELLRRTNERSLATRLIRKYDSSGNGRLSPRELRWSAERIEPIDKNGDGELSRSELVNIEETPLDVDLSVDVAPVSAQKPDFEVHKTTGRRIGTATRPGIANIALPNATLTLSYRHVDPIPAAIENARIKFNNLDADTNGYLEDVEIEGETLLQRGLFDQIDSDQDGKMFAEELESFVRQRAEAKSMSCRVNIYDTGSGIFQTMDHNNDGRVSTREMRSAESSLKALASDDRPGVSRNEPARRYHIEFSRGAYLLFGPSEQREKQTISFNTQVAVGPPWFVGSDRNNDGDLTWKEFLGHREDFHYLDLDGDQLIDPNEAVRAENLRGSESTK